MKKDSCTIVNNHAIIWIPKNCTSVLRAYDPKRYYWKEHEQVDRWHVLLRDPIKRWRSGIIEYYHIHSDRKGSMELAEKMWRDIDKIEFCEHTALQTSFCKDIGWTYYYDLERKGLQKLNDRLKLFRKPIPYRNKTQGNKVKEEFAKKIDRLLADKKFIKKLKDYYEDDYKFIREKIRS